MEPIYAVKNWDELYETHDTRKIKGALKYVMMPNKWDGGGYRRVVTQPDGPVIYAAWMMILQVASRLPRRGVLADADGYGLTAEDISYKTSFPVEAIERAFAVLSDRKIGWLVEYKPESVKEEAKSRQISMFPRNPPEPPAIHPPNDDETEQNGTIPDDDDDRTREAGPPRKPPAKSSSSSAEIPPPTNAEPEALATEADVGGWMRQFAVHEWGVEWGPPDAKIVRRVIAAANGAGLDGLQACLRGMLGMKGPPGRSYAWFEGAVRNHLGEHGGGGSRQGGGDG